MAASILDFWEMCLPCVCIVFKLLLLMEYWGGRGN